MSEENPYQTPESELTQPVEGHIGGSLESALAGNYTFSIAQLLSFGWQKTSGFKAAFWLGAIIYCIASGLVNRLSSAISNGLGFASSFALGINPFTLVPSFLITLILGALVYSLAVGLFLMAINRAADKPVKAGDLFKYWPKLVPIFITYLLMTLLTLIGFCLFILPGIYLSIAYLFALPLLVDKNLTPWEALEASRKAIHHHWGHVFGFCLAMLGLVLVSLIFIGIPLIWLLPTCALAMGRLYIIMFGLEARVIA